VALRRDWSEVQPLAGHTYAFKAERMTGTYRMFLWLRDDSTATVVAGSPKP